MTDTGDIQIKGEDPHYREVLKHSQKRAAERGSGAIMTTVTTEEPWPETDLYTCKACGLTIDRKNPAVMKDWTCICGEPIPHG